MEIKGTIFDIQKFSIHDGPGIRTTVFFKGCGLRCLWCHNPESISIGRLLSFLPEKCIGCGYCFKHCPHKLHSMKDNKHMLDRTQCEVCGSCTQECYAGALEMVGKEVTVEEVLEEVLKDRPFYETSGGGMTLSGGEPLYQIDFAEALLAAAKKAGLHNAIETSGFANYKCFKRVIPYVDLYLFDIKETDPAKHREFTGVKLEPILKNLRRLHDAGALIRMRLPLIPGYNDREDHFEAIAALCRELPNLQGVEIMPYHALGTSKIKRFGLEDQLRDRVKSPERETVQEWIVRLTNLGLHVMNE